MDSLILSFGNKPVHIHVHVHVQYTCNCRYITIGEEEGKENDVNGQYTEALERIEELEKQLNDQEEQCDNNELITKVSSISMKKTYMYMYTLFGCIFSCNFKFYMMHFCFIS